MTKRAYLLVNFGGPRDLDEVEPFLCDLLSDQEVIRTRLPSLIHRMIFHRVARKRAEKVKEDYALIGGGSPIFADTEAVAAKVGEKLNAPVYTFHRYLRKTHPSFIEQMKQLEEVEEIIVVPFFPQFSYATTGSIALFFQKKLPKQIVAKMHWCKSYPTHPSYIQVMQQQIREYLSLQNLQEEEVLLLFSAHGLPQDFIDTGDPYQKECERSYEEIKKAFPLAVTKLSYQSQFGPKPWILPYTSNVVQEIAQYAEGRKEVVMIPLSFTSDHVETLFEVETAYLPVIREQGLRAHRCPALNRREDWIDVLVSLFETTAKNRIKTDGSSKQGLLRK